MSIENSEQMRLAQISQLNRELRKEYAQAKTIRMRIPYKPRARDQNQALAWQKAAEQAYAMGLSANQYITACFDGCSMQAGPFVNILGGAACARWVTEWQSNRKLTSGVSAPPAEPRRAVVGDEATQANIQLRVADLQVMLKAAHYSVLVARKVVQGQPGFLEAVLDEHVVMDVLCRMALAHMQPDLKTYFRDEILDRINSDPLIVSALKTLNYPIDEVYAWLVK